MDYIDPADRRLRDEPIKPLSPEEAEIAAKLYQDNVLAYLLSSLNLPTTNEKETPPDSRYN